MTGYCTTHIVDRTDEELRQRIKEVTQAAVIGAAGVRALNEKARAEAELARRNS